MLLTFLTPSTLNQNNIKFQKKQKYFALQTKNPQILLFWGKFKNILKKCKFMCIHECSCAFMGVHGCSWVFMGVQGCSGVFMGVHGCSWVFMGVHGCSWVFMCFQMFFGDFLKIC